MHWPVEKWLIRHERSIYVACVMLAIIPLVIADRFPSQDGPAHLYIVYLIERLANADAQLSSSFTFSSTLDPNITVYPVLFLLMQLVPPLLAEKLLVGGMWLGFALAARYLVTASGTDRGPFAFLFLPFGFGVYLHLGFYNFFLGSILFMAIAGFYLRRPKEIGVGMFLVLLLGGLLTLLTHLFAWGMLMITIACARTGIAAVELHGRREPPHLVVASLALDGAKVLAASLPALYVAIDFILRHATTGLGTQPPGGVLKLVAYLLTLSPVHGLTLSAAAASVPYIFLVWLLVAAVIWQFARKPRDLIGHAGVLLPVVALLGVFFFFAIGLKDFSAQERILPFLFFLLFVALAQVNAARVLRASIIPIVAAVVLVGTVQRAEFYRQADGMLEDFLAAGAIVEPGSSIFAVQTVERRAEVDGVSVGLRVNVMQHASAILAIERDLVDLSIGLMAPSVYGYFPVVYTPGADVYAHVFSLLPDAQRHEGAVAQGLAPADYILFWPSLPDAVTSAHEPWRLDVRKVAERDFEPLTALGKRPVIFRSQGGDVEPPPALSNIGGLTR